MYLQHRSLGTVIEIPAKPVVDKDGCAVGGSSYLDNIKTYAQGWDARFQTLNPECPNCQGSGIKTAYGPGVKAEGACLPCGALKP